MNIFKSNKWTEKMLKDAIAVLNKHNSVANAATELAINRRKLERMFQKYKLMPPSCYLIIQHGLSKSEKKKIVELYSDFDGKAMSVQEIAELLKKPSELIQEFIKSQKLTHKNLPFMQDDKKQLDSKLIEKAEEIREYKLKIHLENLEREKQKNDALKWKTWKDNVGDKVFELVESKATMYMVEKMNIQPAKKDYCVIFSLQDFHLGRLSHKSEVKDSVSMTHHVQQLIDAVKDLCSKTITFGRAQKIYVTIGGDFINSDNSKSTTTAGTPQDSLPSHTGLMLEGGFVLIKIIDMLRQVFPVVELVPTPGNHDRDTSISMYMFVSAWYRNCPDVVTNFAFNNIPETSCHLRQYRKYGRNLLAFMHGDSSKLKQWPIIIANEAREMWGQTRHTILITGHKHYRISQDLMGIQHIQVPSLAAEDRWSSLNGYQSEKAISMILVDSEAGYMAEIVSSVVE